MHTFALMHPDLKAHILKWVDLEDKDLEAMSAYFEPQNFKKKENLLSEGKVCESSYFVTKGLLRMFFVNSKGVEQTTQFAMENWWIADYASLSAHQPSGFYIQAVETSSVLRLSYKAQEQLLAEFPKMEKYFRLLHQRVHAAMQFRIRLLYDFSREELYRDFNRRHPEFVQRIPQYLLASYLGFTPEYLSEIRKKAIS
jgi:CRP-like cAMP-binding protein